jgi:hypothetical protein
MGYYWEEYINAKPENAGMDEFVGEAELSDESYSFDLVGVWRAEDGYYLGTDSGCSCPTPWESHTRESLTGPLTAAQAREEVESLANVRIRNEWDSGPDNDALSSLLNAIV